jgi:hypothetical protein
MQSGATDAEVRKCIERAESETLVDKVRNYTFV